MTTFNGEVEAAVQELTNVEPCIAITRTEHPVLTAALATKAFSDMTRDRTLEQLANGASPDLVATQLGLAPWFDLVKTEALGSDFLGQPTSATFARRIRTLIPGTVAQQKVLLRTVRIANQCGDEDIALWFARRVVRERFALDDWTIALIAMYFACRGNEAIPASAYIARPVQSDDTLPAIVRGAVSWLGWVLFETLYGPDGVADTWRPGGTFLGITIEPLRSAKDFIEAARHYGNCLPYYAPLIMREASRVFEFSQAGQRIGCMELRMGGAANGYVQLYQIEGPQRQSLGEHERRAAYEMLAAAPQTGSLGRARVVAPHYPQANVMTKRWKALLGPYLAGRSITDHFPSAMDKPRFEMLLRQMLALRRLAQLTGVICEQVVATETVTSEQARRPR